MNLSRNDGFAARGREASLQWSAGQQAPQSGAEPNLQLAAHGCKSTAPEADLGHWPQRMDQSLHVYILNYTFTYFRMPIIYFC